MAEIPSQRVAWRVLQGWLIALLACGGFLATVHRYAPVVLQHDRDTSVWYMSSLAEENWREFHSLPQDSAMDKKRQLLEEAIGHLKQAQKLRPDSLYYLWLHGLVLKALAGLSTPPDPAREAEALCLIHQVWEHPDGRTVKTARFLADDYLAHGRVEQASPFLAFLLEQNPADPLAYDGLVQAAIKVGKTKAAIEALERKAEVAHISPGDRELLAVLAIRSSDYGKAAASLEVLLGSGGETAERWFLYGIALLGRGDVESARRAFGVYKYAVGESAVIPEPPSLGLDEFPRELLAALAENYKAARPAREGFR